MERESLVLSWKNVNAWTKPTFKVKKRIQLLDNGEFSQFSTRVIRAFDLISYRGVILVNLFARKGVQ